MPILILTYMYMSVCVWKHTHLGRNLFYRYFENENVNMEPVYDGIVN